MSETWRRVLGALILILTMGMSTVGALLNVASGAAAGTLWSEAH